MLVVLYHATTNLIQPQWRAWMGSIVPPKQRGIFFAGRSRLTMATSLAVFLLGGLLLSLSERLGLAAAGFFLLFVAAACGRALSCYFLWQMHDPSPQPLLAQANIFFSTLGHIREALSEATFRNYSFFVAGMQGMVAISAPFFAVYLLNELQFTYFEFSINLMASVATQFVMLRFWGKVSDSHGNRLVMLVCSAALPIVPVLWLFSLISIICWQYKLLLEWRGVVLTSLLPTTCTTFVRITPTLPPMPQCKLALLRYWSLVVQFLVVIWLVLPLL